MFAEIRKLLLNHTHTKPKSIKKLFKILIIKFITSIK